MRNPGRTPEPAKGLYALRDADLETFIAWLEYQRGLARSSAIRCNEAVVAGGGEAMARNARYYDHATSCCGQLIVRVEKILGANRLERSKRASNTRAAGGGRD